MGQWHDAEHCAERAQELYRSGRFAEAEAQLRRALAIEPERGQWRHNLGLTLKQLGRFGDAARAFEQAFQTGHDEADTALEAGECFLKAGEASVAVRWLTEARQIAPASILPLVHLIEAHARLNEHEPAELAFYLVQQADDHCAAAYANIAESLAARGLSERSLWCLREAARLDPDLPKIHARLAQAMAAGGRHERARQLYLAELRRDPGDVATILELGVLLVEMNRFAEAGEKFRRVLEIEPENSEAHYCLGDLEDRAGRPDAAIIEFDTAHRLEPDQPGVRRRLAGLLLRRAGVDPRAGEAAAEGPDLEQARSLLTREVAEYRRAPDAYPREHLVDLGRLLLDADLCAEAHRVLKVAAADRPDLAAVWQDLSVACFRLGDVAAGADHARRVLRLDPRHASAHHNLALASIQQSQWTRARYWVQQARRIDPDDAFLRRLRVFLWLHTLAEAVEWTAHAVKRLLVRSR